MQAYRVLGRRRLLRIETLLERVVAGDLALTLVQLFQLEDDELETIEYLMKEPGFAE